MIVCTSCLKFAFLLGNDYERLSNAHATVGHNLNECFTIIITDDNVSEGTEQFTVSFIVDFIDPTTIIWAGASLKCVLPGEYAQLGLPFPGLLGRGLIEVEWTR